MTQEEIFQRMNECPFREETIQGVYSCTRYVDSEGPCDGACSWLVDYPRLKELYEKS